MTLDSLQEIEPTAHKDWVAMGLFLDFNGEFEGIGVDFGFAFMIGDKD
jgi:hypothetical protein